MHSRETSGGQIAQLFAEIASIRAYQAKLAVIRKQIYALYVRQTHEFPAHNTDTEQLEAVLGQAERLEQGQCLAQLEALAADWAVSLDRHEPLILSDWISLSGRGESLEPLLMS